jgi:Fis family transcriptional regulator
MSLQQITQTDLTIEGFAVTTNRQTDPLSDCVRDALEHYFTQLDGCDPVDLYDMVLAEIERPLLECVMAYMGGNQTRAANALGISRSTLRKKLNYYRLD